MGPQCLLIPKNRTSKIFIVHSKHFIVHIRHFIPFKLLKGTRVYDVNFHISHCRTTRRRLITKKCNLLLHTNPDSTPNHTSLKRLT